MENENYALVKVKLAELRENLKQGQAPVATMKQLLTALLPIVLIVGCNSDRSTTAKGGSTSSRWYEQWMKTPLSAGRTIHSDLDLDAGETTTLQIAAAGPIVVGTIVQRGYEVCKENGAIWIGTPGNPHLTGGSPGVFADFIPENGSVSLVVENESSLKTRVAIYTKASDPATKP